MTSAIRENMDLILFQRKWNTSSIESQKVLVQKFLQLNPDFGVFVPSTKLLERNAISFKSALSEARVNPEQSGSFSRSSSMTRFDEIVKWIRATVPFQPKVLDDLNDVFQTRKKIGFGMKYFYQESKYESLNRRYGFIFKSTLKIPNFYLN